MNNAIILGIIWHLVGAASAACFYAPFKQVKKWSWETMWSIGGLVSWLILPWTVSYLLLPDFLAILRFLQHRYLTAGISIRRYVGDR